MTEDVISEEDLKKLPLLLAIGFAARCARRALNIIQPNVAIEEFQDTVLSAIAVAEGFATSGVAPSSSEVSSAVHDASAAAINIANVPDASAAVNVIHAASSAANACYAIAADSEGEFRLPSSVYSQVAMAARFAAHAALDVKTFDKRTIGRKMKADFNALLKIAKEREDSFLVLGGAIEVGESGPLGPLLPATNRKGFPQKKE